MTEKASFEARRQEMARRTLSGEAREGWFIPYRHAADARPEAVAPAVERIFAGAADRFEATLGLIAGYREALLAIGADDPAPGPRWDQDWFAGLDAAAAYALVRDRRPARIVEIGSGHSTRFMIRAVRDGDVDCAVTAIDPAPRADIAALPLTLMQDIVQNADRSVFAALRPGDVLSIDSSHILMPGTDVDLLFGEIIPALPAGVLVHVHDIFLPWPYPEDWEARGYNEQNALRPLIAAGALEPLFASQYAARAMTEVCGRLTGFIPRPRPNHDASFWAVRA
ncbi:class I SAM-dependent methyltransferase [Minwuia thermotolerans]|uniref:Class I SAM-dependent methyltransferase n=1 Tax=Minwuia thermotolerans TaxID=2056226 RepID=A0A2M9FZJ4_9PROT|nr:class I SAM-dependent methyltransferase [Minwuia thermotolerans]PJK28886.1 class I SAM-dependent methyltransferase [Minwuia thermotolerans]